MRGLGGDEVESPLSTPASVIHNPDQNSLMWPVESHRLLLCLGIIELGRGRIGVTNSWSLSHESAGIVGTPGSVAVKREEVNGHKSG